MNAVLFVVVLDVLSDVVACDVIFDIIFVVNVKVNVDINVLSHHITVLLLLSSWVFRIRTKQTIPWEGRKDRSERKGIHNSQKHLQSRDGRLMPARSRLRSERRRPKMLQIKRLPRRSPKMYVSSFVMVLC